MASGVKDTQGPAPAGPSPSRPLDFILPLWSEPIPWPPAPSCPQPTGSPSLRLPCRASHQSGRCRPTGQLGPWAHSTGSHCKKGAWSLRLALLLAFLFRAPLGSMTRASPSHSQSGLSGASGLPLSAAELSVRRSAAPGGACSQARGLKRGWAQPGAPAPRETDRAVTVGFRVSGRNPLRVGSVWAWPAPLTQGLTWPLLLLSPHRMRTS